MDVTYGHPAISQPSHFAVLAIYDESDLSPQTLTSLGASLAVLTGLVVWSFNMSSYSGTNSFPSTLILNRVTATTDPGPSDSATASLVASTSVPISESSSVPLASSKPVPSSEPYVSAIQSSTVPTITSALPSQTLRQNLPVTGVSLLHNKPAMIAIITSIGIFALMIILIFGAIMVLKKRQRGLIKGAITFSPITEHFVEDDNYGGAVAAAAL